MDALVPLPQDTPPIPSPSPPLLFLLLFSTLSEKRGAMSEVKVLHIDVGDDDPITMRCKPHTTVGGAAAKCRHLFEDEGASTVGVWLEHNGVRLPDGLQTSAVCDSAVLTLVFADEQRDETQNSAPLREIATNFPSLSVRSGKVMTEESAQSARAEAKARRAQKTRPDPVADGDAMVLRALSQNRLDAIPVAALQKFLIGRGVSAMGTRKALLARIEKLAPVIARAEGFQELSTAPMF